MRLWHKDLIPVLPRQQLLGQWRECCLIAKNIAEKGTPNHILVNKIMDYPIDHFMRYSREIFYQMKKRGYSSDFKKFSQYSNEKTLSGWDMSIKEVFPDWHNDRYLAQCFYNLQEKFDCGGIFGEEWAKIDAMWIEKMFTFKMDIEK